MELLLYVLQPIRGFDSKSLHLDWKFVDAGSKNKCV